MDNFDEFSEGLVKLIDSIRDASAQTGDINRDAERAEAARNKARQVREEEIQKAYQKQLNAINQVTGAIGSTVRSFSQGSGSFQGLANVTEMTSGIIGKLAGKFLPFGGVIEGLANAAGQAAAAMIQTFDKFYSSYEELSKIGIVATTTDFKNAMMATKLNIQDTSKVLGRYGKELAYFGNSAIAGRASFEEVASQSDEYRRELQQLGISSVEFSEIQIGYLDRLARSGNLAGKSTEQLAIESKEYALEIDKLSKLTGLSREQIQKDLDARMRDARYRAGIATLDEPIRKGVDGFLTQLKALAPDMEEGMKDLIASGGVPTTELAKKTFIALSQGGMNVQSFVEQLRTGAVGGTGAMLELAKATKGSEQKFRQLAKIIGSESDVTGLYVALADLSKQLDSGAITREEAEERIKKIQNDALKGKDKENTALSNTRNSLYNLQTNIELTMISFSSLTTGMDFFSDALEGASEYLFKFIDKNDWPEYMKLRDEDKKLRKEEKKVKKEILDLEKEQEKLLQEAKVAGLNTTSGAQAKAKEIEQKQGQLKGIQSSRQAVSQKYQAEMAENAALSGRGVTMEQLRAMGLKVKEGAHVNGKPLSESTIQLALRVQKELDTNFKEFTSFNDNTARDVKSKHPLGGAFDFTLKGEKITPEEGQNLIAQIKNMGAANVLDEYNFKTLMASGPHIHVEAFKDGGTIHNPTLSLMGEAGSEAVVPLPDGRSIPVSMDSTLSDRLDTLIRIAERQTSLLGNVFDRLA